MAIDAKTTLAAVAVCLAVFGPATAWAVEPDLEIREQPTTVARPDVVRIEWAGQPAAVVVERKHGLFWVREGSDSSGEILVEDVGDGVWSASWQSTYYSSSGDYRIRLEGADQVVTSDVFEVRPCGCVIPGMLRTKWRDRRFRLSVSGVYLPGPADGFRALPTRVTTGRPLVRVLRNGRRIGSVLMRYENGRFRGTWRGPRGPRHSVVFRLIALTDRFGNS